MLKFNKIINNHDNKIGGIQLDIQTKDVESLKESVSKFNKKNKENIYLTLALCGEKFWLFSKVLKD